MLANSQYVPWGERLARRTGKDFVTMKMARFARNMMTPARTLYSLGNNSPRKTHCRGAAPAPKQNM